MKTFIFSFLFVAFALSAVAVPQAAQAGDFFFPNVKRQVREQYAANAEANKDLKAPFIAEENLTEAQESRATGVPLNLPNINRAELSRWVSSAITDALTLTGEDVRSDVPKARGYFTPSGQRQYLEFITSTNIVSNLSSGHYQLNSAVQLEPLLIGQQEADGRYKWLYDVQVLLSYLHAGTTSYDRAVPQNQTLNLRVQVTRAEETSSDDTGVRIEIWKRN